MSKKQGVQKMKLAPNAFKKDRNIANVSEGREYVLPVMKVNVLIEGRAG